jgi:hypothetical protein
LTSRASHTSSGVEIHTSRKAPGPPAASTVARTQRRVASYGAIGAHTARPPCFVTSAATQPIRRMLTSRSAAEKPRPLDRCVRTTSPSSTVTWRPRSSISTVSTSAVVDLPAPESPVNHTHAPWRCRGGYVSPRIAATSGRVNHAGSARPRLRKSSRTWVPEIVAVRTSFATLATSS